VGGTSFGAPCWAAIIALANQNRKEALGNLTDGHKALYNQAGTQANFNLTGAFRDITQGYNGDYAAGPGYDKVTGLGSPVANILIPRLRASTAK
jgi:subtilase family serine protease